MPRQARSDLPHIRQHIVQRGNDRRLLLPAHRLQPLPGRTAQHRRHAGCATHAYVLMTNHVHLLMTPSQPGQLGAVMQALGRRYVRYVNDRHHRTGTLWEGR